jgi:hypothetical protein
LGISAEWEAISLRSIAGGFLGHPWWGGFLNVVLLRLSFQINPPLRMMDLMGAEGAIGIDGNWIDCLFDWHLTIGRSTIRIFDG